MKPKVVGISGGSCSGKTTLANRLFDEFGSERCVILPQDDYFFGLGDAPKGKGGPNFDHPNAVDFDNMSQQLALLKKGETIERPLYDFPTHLPKKETHWTEPRPIILVDGILILNNAPLRAQLDLAIFVECAAATRLTRRLKRDVTERSRTTESVGDIFKLQVDPMHKKYVEPSKRYADIIVNSQQSKSGFAASFVDILAQINALSL